MLDPHVRTALSPVAGEPGKYSVTFRVPDRHGVFKFVVDYKRKGYVHSTHTFTWSLIVYMYPAGPTCRALPLCPWFPRGTMDTRASSAPRGHITQARSVLALPSSCSSRCGWQAMTASPRRTRARRWSEGMPQYTSITSASICAMHKALHLISMTGHKTATGPMTAQL